MENELTWKQEFEKVVLKERQLVDTNVEKIGDKIFLSLYFSDNGLMEKASRVSKWTFDISLLTGDKC